MLGSVGIATCATDMKWTDNTLDLPDVLVVASNQIPLNIGLHTSSRARLVIDTAARAITVTRPLSSDAAENLFLPTAPHRISTCYTVPGLAKIHRQFGDTGTDKVVAASPSKTFTRQDIFELKHIVESCDACQTHAHLPRRPKYSLPNRPAYFNRVVLPDVFTIDNKLHNVLDITCMETDYGTGSLLLNLRAELIVGVLYLSWLTRYGQCETVISDQGSNLDAPAVKNILCSIGVHFRVAPTEAPWSIGKNERHHGPTRTAFLRARAESSRVNPVLLLDLAYKSRNDEPQASGASPTIAVFGEHPRLMVGDNSQGDPSCAARARTSQAAMAALQTYTIPDCLQCVLSHPGTTVPYVTVGQHVLFYRDEKGWRHARVQSIDDKDI